MQENNGANVFYTVLVTLGGIFGIINIIKAFRSPVVLSNEQYENIIAEKDKIIETLEKRIVQYQKIIEYDNERQRRME